MYLDSWRFANVVINISRQRFWLNVGSRKVLAQLTPKLAMSQLERRPEPQRAMTTAPFQAYCEEATADNFVLICANALGVLELLALLAL